MYSFLSPAKLNLFLHVVGQRADGYHNLQTLFQFLDYGDTLNISINHSGNIELATPMEGVEEHDNLIIKAANILKKALEQENKMSPAEIIYGAKISIDKILPMGGGLGGGSSNAATVLLALNSLWKANFSTEKLARLGLVLGADVPIFIHGFSALAEGVGEQLIKIEPTEYWYLISKPNCSISTMSVFTAKDLPRDTKKLPLAEIKSTDYFDKYHDDLQNDCQTMVIKHYPEVAKLLAWLVEYAPSRMTGTGACIFSRFNSKNEACQLQSQLPKGITSFVAQAVNQSPTLNAIKALN
jgi:4-diphosphocytidyl-2-C-methyl-D-erythritol kinase